MKFLFHIICQTIQNCIILFHFPNYYVPAVHNPQDRPEIHYQRTARGEQSVSAWSFETSDITTVKCAYGNMAPIQNKADVSVFASDVINNS